MNLFITLGDFIGIVLGLLVLLIIVAVALVDTWKQWRCKHDGRVHETSSCQAICCKCGKNLGFIGAWRDKQRSTTP